MNRINPLPAVLAALLLAPACPALAQFQNPQQQFARIAEERLETEENAVRCRELTPVELADLVRAQPPAAQLSSGNVSFFCEAFSRRTGTDEGITDGMSIVFINRRGEVQPIILKP